METIKHDTDGNLTHDAGKNIRGIPFEFVWDAENRLVKVLRDWDDALIARYYYDYLGRRVRSVTTALGPQGVKDTGYVYDGWNLLTEYDLTLGTSAPVGMAYLWGTDLSGGLQGAGGVGGLLEVSIGGTVHHYPIYDGNGNVTKYIASNGTTSASYRYDPFGQLVGTTGTWESFRHRFSTKPQDRETGLLYYGHRYLETTTGRWPSRDPIGERGGLNLYGFVGNDGVNKWDYLGMEWSQVDESFEWTQELQIHRWKPHFDNPTNGVAEFMYADVTWKGTATVTCICSESGEIREASGGLTANVEARSNDWLYFPSIPKGPMGVATSVDDVILDILVDSLLDALPPGVTDEGGSAGDIAQAVLDSKPSDGDKSIRWDNKLNPCQELNKK